MFEHLKLNNPGGRQNVCNHQLNVAQHRCVAHFNILYYLQALHAISLTTNFIGVAKTAHLKRILLGPAPIT